MEEAVVHEGKVAVVVPVAKTPSKKMTVFYNPVMQVNRDITILLLNALPKKEMRIADPLAGTGIRTVRMAKELAPGKIDHLFVNDQSEKATSLIKENLYHNKLQRYDEHNEKMFDKEEKEKQQHHIHVYRKDANAFLQQSLGFDYIDIDPFGSPNPFLDNAVQRLGRNGVLAVTATDTSALAGTYINACKRKYWAVPKRDSVKHERGLRILIRKVQLVAAQYEKALTPLYSYSHKHYMRVFFVMEKGKKKVDVILKQHGMWDDTGPLWNGALWDDNLAKKIAKAAEKKWFCEETKKITSVIAKEAGVLSEKFVDIHALVKKEKVKQIPSFDQLIRAMKAKKYKVARTHFAETGLRTTMREEKIIKLIQEISKNKSERKKK